MATVQRRILTAVLARLREVTPPALPLVPTPDKRVRLSHRTPPDVPESPSVYVVVERDRLVKSRDCDDRVLAFRVEVYGRSDAGVGSIDELLEAVLQRLKPVNGHAIPYPRGTNLDQVDLTLDEEVADTDVAFGALAFNARYSVRTWSLTEAA